MRAIFLLPLLSLAGCITFGAKPPPQLLTLSAAQPIAAGATGNSGTQRSIVVQVPSVPAALATPRVPVQSAPTTVAYIPKALWSEPPNRLFARLLADTLTVRAGMIVLSGVQSLSDPSATLGGELRAFTIDADARQAVVIYDATLVRPGTTQVQKRRFEGRAPVAAVDPTDAATALNAAANDVAGQVADWVRG